MVQELHPDNITALHADRERHVKNQLEKQMVERPIKKPLALIVVIIIAIVLGVTGVVLLSSRA
jgi:hypothetical protein